MASHVITASVKMSLRAAVVETVEQRDAQLAGTTALAGGASVMRFQPGGLEKTE